MKFKCTCAANQHCTMHDSIPGFEVLSYEILKPKFMAKPEFHPSALDIAKETLKPGVEAMAASIEREAELQFHQDAFRIEET